MFRLAARAAGLRDFRFTGRWGGWKIERMMSQYPTVADPLRAAVEAVSGSELPVVRVKAQ